MKPRLFLASVMTLAGYAFAIFPAYASGNIPPIETVEKRKNFDDCVSILDTKYVQNQNQVKSRTVDDEGLVHEVTLVSSTDGVKHTGKKFSQYTGRLWFHNGKKIAGSNQTEFSHSWSESNYQCIGKTLKTASSQGYTLSTFDTDSE